VIDRFDNQEEDHRGQDHERDERVHEIPVEKTRAVYIEVEVGEVRLATGCGHERRDEVLDQCLNNGVESQADHHGNC
jgi:hypothetical protein